jgi:hypothetical protein
MADFVEVNVVRQAHHERILGFLEMPNDEKLI